MTFSCTENIFKKPYYYLLGKQNTNTNNYIMFNKTYFLLLKSTTFGENSFYKTQTPLKLISTDYEQTQNKILFKKKSSIILKNTSVQNKTTNSYWYNLTLYNCTRFNKLTTKSSFFKSTIPPIYKKKIMYMSNVVLVDDNDFFSTSNDIFLSKNLNKTYLFLKKIIKLSPNVLLNLKVKTKALTPLLLSNYTNSVINNPPFKKQLTFIKYSPYIITNRIHTIGFFTNTRFVGKMQLQDFSSYACENKQLTKALLWADITFLKINYKDYLLTFFTTSTQNLALNRSTLNRDKVHTQTKNPLTLLNISSLIISNFSFFKNLFKKQYKYLFKLKKNYYSFNKPNQIKTLILKRRTAIILHKLVLNNHYKDVSKALASNNYHKLTKTNFTRIRFNNLIYQNNTEVSTYNHLRAPAPDSTQYEVKIPRVRFKPGYQRLWREARLALKDLIGVKFTYQKQLTKHICRFLKTSTLRYKLREELSLDKLVIYSRLVPDYNTFTTLFNSNLFFLNGRKLFNTKINCVVNDFIQLIISKWYYIFFRWLINWVLTRTLKLKRLVYRKGLSTKYGIVKARKQRSFNVPDWIFTSKFDFSDVKPFIEVDYFTLSFFIIYEPYLTHYYSPTKYLLPKTNIYKLYNWKYIT